MRRRASTGSPWSCTIAIFLLAIFLSEQVQSVRWHHRQRTEKAAQGGVSDEEFNLESAGEAAVELPTRVFEDRREVWEIAPLESENVQSLARQAAKEVRRYLYLTSGSIHHLRTTSVQEVLEWTRSGDLPAHPQHKVKEIALVLASTTAAELIQALEKSAEVDYVQLTSDKEPLHKQALYSQLSMLADEEHVLQTIQLNDPGGAVSKRSRHYRRIHIISGGGPSGMLYAAYRFAEVALGVRFLPHGDVIPDITAGSSTCRHTSPSAVAAGDKESTFNYRFRCAEVPPVSEVNRPVYADRGVLWWPKFAEGVDTWNHTDYRMHLEQLTKMRMNFVSIHSSTYSPHVQVAGTDDPVVWMGLAHQVASNGHVNGSYASALFSTCRGEWGYQNISTGDYAFGLGKLFEADCWGGPAQAGEALLCPFPATPEARDEVFNRVGDLIGASLSYAHDIGLRTGMGVDIPTKVPVDTMQANLEGMFLRLHRLFPQLEEFWLWTPKEWATSTLATSITRPADVLSTVQSAIAAQRKTESAFRLGLAGTALGPRDGMAYLSKEVSEEMSVVMEDGHNGREGLDSEWSFQGQAAKKWEVVWMEDESGLTTSQYWVRRTLERSKAAAAKGVGGMVALHWRTRGLAAQMSAFASSLWQNHEREPTNSQDRPVGAYQHELAAHEFWLDWVATHFGVEDNGHLHAIATLLAFHDGDAMPRPAKWDGGPGAVDADISQCDWPRQYAWVDNFAAMRSHVSGVSNLARFDYWLSTFAYVRTMAKCSCAWGQYDATVQRKKTGAHKAPVQEQSQDMAELIRGRAQLMANVTELVGHLLTHCSTMGELGTVINLLSHSFSSLIGHKANKALRELVDGVPLPKSVFAPSSLSLPPRIIMPAARSTLAVGESLFVKVHVLSTAGESPRAVTLHVRSLYDDRFHSYEMEAMQPGRHVYAQSLLLESDFEFYVTAEVGDAKLVYPPSAPAVCQTVVIRP